MEIPASYKGREQAFIKHGLLRTYLERLFMIVGQHQRTICHVDRSSHIKRQCEKQKVAFFFKQ